MSSQRAIEEYLGPYGAEGYGRIGDTWYGLPDDGDLFIMYYRTDLFNDQANKDAFQAKYGRELTVPKTYKEFDEVRRILHRAVGAGCLWRRLPASGGSGFSTGSSAPLPEPVGQYFDPETMDAAINSDTGVQVLTDMVNATKWMPPGVQTWGFTEVLRAHGSTARLP